MSFYKKLPVFVLTGMAAIIPVAAHARVSYYTYGEPSSRGYYDHRLVQDRRGSWDSYRDSRRNYDYDRYRDDDRDGRDWRDNNGHDKDRDWDIDSADRRDSEKWNDNRYGRSYGRFMETDRAVSAYTAPPGVNYNAPADVTINSSSTITSTSSYKSVPVR